MTALNLGYRLIPEVYLAFHQAHFKAVPVSRHVFYLLHSHSYPFRNLSAIWAPRCVETEICTVC